MAHSDTFSSFSDLEKFLTEADISKMFKQNNLSVRVLERTCSLRMEGLPSQANKDLLGFYYETQKVEVKTVIMISEENAAVVTLLKPEGNMFSSCLCPYALMQDILCDYMCHPFNQSIHRHSRHSLA